MEGAIYDEKYARDSKDMKVSCIKVIQFLVIQSWTTVEERVHYNQLKTIRYLYINRMYTSISSFIYIYIFIHILCQSNLFV